MYNPELHFHFVGIGGVGMSGLAEVLLSQGFRVSGSDLSFNSACERLVAAGAVIYPKHEAQNVTVDIAAVVYSSAVPQDNPELQRAREFKIPIVPRAAVLAELMRLKHGVAVAGSHGKTSTSSLLAAVMEGGGLDPTVIIGGVVRNYDSTGKNGGSQYLVAEADESDKSFLLLKPTIAVVTNIDEEHMDCYKNMETVETAFRQFISSVPFYGLAVLCVDDPRVQKIAREVSCRVVTYAINEPAKIQAKFISINEKGTVFSVFNEGKLLGDVHLPMIGKHYMQNALATVAVGLEFAIPFAKIKASLEGFQGVGRRTELIANAKHTLINDYGHHPTEIKATVSAIKAAYENTDKRIVVFFQPHRFSRTKDCWQELKKCFAGADLVLFSDIYPAGEAPIAGIDSKSFIDEMSADNFRYVGSLAGGLEYLQANQSASDVILSLGAGSIGKFTYNELNEFVVNS